MFGPLPTRNVGRAGRTAAVDGARARAGQPYNELGRAAGVGAEGGTEADRRTEATAGCYTNSHDTICKAKGG